MQKPGLVAAGRRGTRFWHQYVTDTLRQTDQPDRAVVLVRETLGDSVIGGGSAHVPPSKYARDPSRSAGDVLRFDDAKRP